MGLIRFTSVIKERVLVFGQFIEPLTFIIEQLEPCFGWNEGKKMLYIDGKQDVKKCQASSNTFNDLSNKVNVLFTSTKACFEGINLVGASRVV